MATVIQTTDRDGWLAARRRYLTASDAASVLGHSPWRSRLDVWLDKRGEAAPFDESERMRLGRLLEPAILRRYALDTDLVVHPNDLLHASDAHPWIACTPDAIVMDSGKQAGLAQAKATSSVSSWPDGQPPIYYQIQAAVEMAVMDAPWDDFPTLIAGADYTCPRVERHAAAEDAILSELHEFWERYVVTGLTPPPASENDMKVWARLVPPVERKIVSLPADAVAAFDAWQSAKATAAAAEKQAKDLQAQLLAMQGDAEVGVIEARGMALKRATVTVPEKMVKGYTFERFTAAKWKGTY
jgi:putative phage-type endonuclease